MPNTPDPQAAVVERVARHLAARDWLTTDDRWDGATAAFRADYLAAAREVLALVPSAAETTTRAASDAVRERLLAALDFAYCQGLGYDTPEALLAAYDATQSVPPPADRATLLREAADAVFALDYDVMVGEEGDENLGSMREAWDLGTIHATELLRRVAAEEQPTETQGTSCPDPIECGHEAALGEARATNQRLNYRAQQLESELGAYRRAVRQWEVSERGTYIPHSSLRAIGKACGVDVLGTVRHLKHFERVEQAEAAVARVRALHQQYRFAGDDSTDYCAHCNQISGGWIPWPCPTIAALDAERPNNAEAQAACGRPASIEGPCSAGDWCCTGPAVAEQPDTQTREAGS